MASTGPLAVARGPQHRAPSPLPLHRERQIRYLCTTKSMTSVGIRELRQRARDLLRPVEAGETIEITAGSVTLAPQIAQSATCGAGLGVCS